MGSQYLSAPTPTTRFVDSRACRLSRPYPPHSARSCAPRVLSGWKRGIAGVQAQPLGLRPTPTFSLANSPRSLVDRKRLLTAPSNAGGPRTQDFQLGPYPSTLLEHLRCQPLGIRPLNAAVRRTQADDEKNPISGSPGFPISSARSSSRLPSSHEVSGRRQQL